MSVLRRTLARLRAMRHIEWVLLIALLALLMLRIGNTWDSSQQESSELERRMEAVLECIQGAGEVRVLVNSTSTMTTFADDYAESVIRLNKLNTVNAAIETEGDLVYFSFEQEVLGKECCFTAFVYKSNDAFWLVQFVCDVEDAAEKEPAAPDSARRTGESSRQAAK